LLLGRAPEERGLRVERLQVAADRHRLCDVAAVVELEHGEATEGVDALEELGAAVGARHDVDGLERDLESLLGEEEVHAARIGRPGIGIELHGAGLVRRAARDQPPRAPPP
jgi:hypothetical protein